MIENDPQQKLTVVGVLHVTEGMPAVEEFAKCNPEKPEQLYIEATDYRPGTVLTGGNSRFAPRYITLRSKDNTAIAVDGSYVDPESELADNFLFSTVQAILHRAIDGYVPNNNELHNVDFYQTVVLRRNEVMARQLASMLLLRKNELMVGCSHMTIDINLSRHVPELAVYANLVVPPEITGIAACINRLQRQREESGESNVKEFVASEVILKILISKLLERNVSAANFGPRYYDVSDEIIAEIAHIIFNPVHVTSFYNFNLRLAKSSRDKIEDVINASKLPVSSGASA